MGVCSLFGPFPCNIYLVLCVWPYIFYGCFSRSPSDQVGRARSTQIARGAIEKGGDEPLRKAVVTDVKKVKGRVTTRSGQVVHKIIYAILVD